MQMGEWGGGNADKWGAKFQAGEGEKMEVDGAKKYNQVRGKNTNRCGTKMEADEGRNTNR